MAVGIPPLDKFKPISLKPRTLPKIEKAPMGEISSEDINKKNPSKDSPGRGKGKRKKGKKSPPLPPSPAR